jgi:hypothetical protein
MSPLTTKAQSLKIESKTHEAQLEDPKSKKSSRRSSRRRKTTKANKRQEKRQSQAKWQERVRKSSEEQEKLKSGQKLKISTKAQNQHSPPEINSP